MTIEQRAEELAREYISTYSHQYEVDHGEPPNVIWNPEIIDLKELILPALQAARNEGLEVAALECCKYAEAMTAGSGIFTISITTRERVAAAKKCAIRIRALKSKPASEGENK